MRDQEMLKKAPSVGSRSPNFWPRVEYATDLASGDLFWDTLGLCDRAFTPAADFRLTAESVAKLHE